MAQIRHACEEEENVFVSGLWIAKLEFEFVKNQGRGSISERAQDITEEGHEVARPPSTSSYLSEATPSNTCSNHATSHPEPSAFIHRGPQLLRTPSRSPKPSRKAPPPLVTPYTCKGSQGQPSKRGGEGKASGPWQSLSWWRRADGVLLRRRAFERGLASDDGSWAWQLGFFFRSSSILLSTSLSSDSDS